MKPRNESFIILAILLTTRVSLSKRCTQPFASRTVTRTEEMENFATHWAWEGLMSTDLAAEKWRYGLITVSVTPAD